LEDNFEKNHYLNIMIYVKTNAKGHTLCGVWYIIIMVFHFSVQIKNALFSIITVKKLHFEIV